MLSEVFFLFIGTMIGVLQTLSKLIVLVLLAHSYHSVATEETKIGATK